MPRKLAGEHPNSASADRQIPTILSYVDGDEYYGGQAKSFLVRNPDNTVAYFKDFLGKDFKSIDPTHNHASAHPQESGSTIAFEVKDKEGEDGPSKVTVSEVTTRYLCRLVGSASDYLGKKVTSAVVTSVSSGVARPTFRQFNSRNSPSPSSQSSRSSWMIAPYRC